MTRDEAIWRRLRRFTPVVLTSVLAFGAIAFVGCQDGVKSKQRADTVGMGDGGMCDTCNMGDTCPQTGMGCDGTTSMCQCNPPLGWPLSSDQSSGCSSGCCAPDDPNNTSGSWSCFAGQPASGWCLTDADCGDPSYYCKVDQSNGCSGNVCTARCGTTNTDGGAVDNGQVWNPDTMTCECQDGSTWNADTQMCECSGGAMIDEFGDCACPQDTVWNPDTSNCDCIIGAQYNSTGCQCPMGQTNDGYECVCDNGGDPNNGCLCTGMQIPVDDGNGGTVCGCPDGEASIPGTDQCQCPPGTDRAPNGNCEPLCTTTGDCPSGMVCIDNFCQPTCNGGTCPPGTYCDPYSSQCVPTCTPQSCPSGQVCNTATGTCQPDPCGVCPPGSTCQAGSCQPTACNGCGPGMGCPTGSYCVGGYCNTNCNTDADCAAGLACVGGACEPGPTLCGASTPNDAIEILQARNAGVSPAAYGVSCVCGQTCTGVASPLCLEAQPIFTADGYWASYCGVCFKGGLRAPCYQVRNAFLQSHNLKQSQAH